MPVDVLLRDALFPDGSLGSLAIHGGRVIDSADSAGEVVPLDGRLLLPAMAEPHAHLDKAFTADRFPNPTGDLATAIEVTLAGWPSVDQADIETRAEMAARRLLVSGTTAIRTHADVDVANGLKSVRALTAVRDRLVELQDIQVVALASPLTGPRGAEGRSLLDTAVEAGVDVIGSCPHIEDDPIGTIEHTLTVAASSGLPVDLHFDEVLDPSVQHLLELARIVEEHGLGGRVTASHCVSHGLLDPASQRDIARVLAHSGISVIANPRTNLFLQARGREQAPPRGILGIAAMLEEGVTVAAGADNVQDPFYVIGRCDPLETASLLVAAAHRTIAEAWQLVSDGARAVMGLESPSYALGAPADFVALRAGSLREAIADQSSDRIVIRRGRVVARTTVTQWIEDD
jgi:cytosine/creatinine deaminase